MSVLKSLCLYLIFIIIVLDNSRVLEASFRRYRFVVKERSYKRLCETKKILTVNGKFPGPAIKVHQGETIFVDVYNKGRYNITIHWHGVKQLRNPWSDGPGYITQCPIQPGNRFRQKVIFSEEIGTVWWHAHIDWERATVHGPIIIYPRPPDTYPFPKPAAEIPIVLGEWWREDVRRVLEEFVESGGAPRDSDAYTINGQPGDFYPCSSRDIFKMHVNPNRTYLLRIINAAMNEIHFFGIVRHKLTVVSTDASYTKPLTRDYIVIAPGQSMDCLLIADQNPDYYYIAAKPFVDAAIIFDNTTTTGLLQYKGVDNYTPSPSTELPSLPPFNDTPSVFNFSYSLRSLNSKAHPNYVPLKINKRVVSTVSINLLPCATNQTCAGLNGTRLAATMNNVSFVPPNTSILEAYFYQISGVFRKNFPKFPPFAFNYTADSFPFELLFPRRGTKALVLRYNASVEVVFQNTNMVAGLSHPMHLHGYHFYVVGSGFGNFDKERDPLGYNLVDPQRRNTIVVPRGGWTAIRFQAYNPGVWFLHCHLERHLTWGMDTVFIVRNGKGPTERVLPPPPDFPPC